LLILIAVLLVYLSLLPHAIRIGKAARAAHDPRRTRLLADLELALAEGELELHYQPIARAGDLTITAVEALARWRHPVRGLVAPGDFLPAVVGSELAWPPPRSSTTACLRGLAHCSRATASTRP
jgi:sensor c-di-GMP phosphodiesterase-like protein